jgi:hypothetical protein
VYARLVKSFLVASSAVVVALSGALSGCKGDPKPEAAAGGAASPTAGAEGALVALKNFEGEVGLQVKSATQTQPIPPITLQVKGSKLRFDVPEGVKGPGMGKKMHVVIDAPAKKLSAVIDDQKQVVTLDLDKLSEQFKGMMPPGAAGETKPAEPAVPPKVTKTGQMSVVAGYKCEDWDIVSPKGERAKICVASEGASWFQVPSIGLPADHAWAKELFDGQHLPLRFIGFDAAGTEETRLEVTRLDRKPIADDVFAIPPDYKIVELSELLRGLMGGFGGPAGLAGTLRPLAPGSSAYPPAMQMPPGVALPPGMKPPQTPEELMKMIQEHAKAMSTATAPQPK